MVLNRAYLETGNRPVTSAITLNSVTDQHVSLNFETRIKSLTIGQADKQLNLGGTPDCQYLEL